MYSGFDLCTQGRALLTDGTLISFVKIDAWIATVVKYLVVQETSSGYRQKKYCDLFGKMLQIAKIQLIKTVHRFFV